MRTQPLQGFKQERNCTSLLGQNHARSQMPFLETQKSSREESSADPALAESPDEDFTLVPRDRESCRCTGLLVTVERSKWLL
nr:hypothetical protein CFP56_69524 [Quercus suber]